MARSQVRLDRAGIRQILRSPELGRAVHNVAEDLAAEVSAHPTIARNKARVGVDDRITDRVVSYVTIKHPAGLAMQAKYGLLTRAKRSGR